MTKDIGEELCKQLSCDGDAGNIVIRVGNDMKLDPEGGLLFSTVVNLKETNIENTWRLYRERGTWRLMDLQENRSAIHLHENPEAPNTPPVPLSVGIAPMLKVIHNRVYRELSKKYHEPRWE